jgi:prepilin-type N-terminal cleavage/methylation domain-containing protein
MTSRRPTLHADRAGRGFSLPEILVTVALVAVVSTLAVAGYRFIRSETTERRAESTLISAAGAQEAYHQSRGTWATGAALTGIGRGGTTLTDGASTGEDTVSVAPVEVDGVTWLGVAVLSEGANCITLLLPPPDQSSDRQIERRVVAAGDTCHGTDAA